MITPEFIFVFYFVIINIFLKENENKFYKDKVSLDNFLSRYCEMSFQ